MRRKSGTVALAVLSIALTASACGSLPSSSSGSSAQGASSAQQSALDQTDWKSSTFAKAPITVSGNTVSIDVGNGLTVTQDKTKPLKIAYLNQGSTNSYLQANVKGATDAAKAAGVEMTVFDGGFDAKTQQSQIENAINGGQFNAFLALTVDGNATCQDLTKTAPSKNILVVNLTQPLCNRGLNTGMDLWAPGTLSQTAGGGTLEFYQAWANKVASSLTAPTEVVYITGPEILTTTQAATQALREAEKKYPNFKLVDIKYTDFSAAQSLAATQNVLIAHPNVGLIMSHFTPLTTGIVQALQQAGKTDTVKIYDVGGDSVAKTYLQDGKTAQTVPYYPYSTAACAVQMLVAAHSGESVPRLVMNDCAKSPGGSGVETPQFFTKDNVNDLTPEY